ncbi:conserved phage C-terminal domain-containing protein [Sporosarcina sp. E16_3]|uniref:conserved phage C-terminal domain-containing protein n=1 Tax=Sporosarcina sp. E16_3 TaxID=2789293 RepID=UPI001A91C71A|nr:conserved phage C-terminal domain-containing protein [Sporosarcina sp. E16_3]MBO0602535.1 conserved phage C-terminal domain-containing protein [Sporosarcina sp. E16_3]
MNFFIKESPLQVISSLAMLVGLNAAILLQQLHFKSLISTNVRNGYKSVYKTYEERKNEEFPFWSVDTIKRAIRRLEDSGYIISTSSYYRMKMDKTKWNRINYTKLQSQAVQHAPSTTAKSTHEEVRIAPSTEGKTPLAITKENKSIKEELVEDDVVSVIDYLNDKAGKQFKASSKDTARLVKGRFSEGYTLAEVFTPFHGNYLEESGASDLPESSPPKPLELDFSEGEA